MGRVCHTRALTIETENNEHLRFINSTPLWYNIFFLKDYIFQAAFLVTVLII